MHTIPDTVHNIARYDVLAWHSEEMGCMSPQILHGRIGTSEFEARPFVHRRTKEIVERLNQLY